MVILQGFTERIYYPDDPNPASSGGDGMMNDNLIVMTIILDRDQNHFFPIRGSSIHRATLGYAA